MPSQESQLNCFALFLFMIFDDDLELGWQINQETVWGICERQKHISLCSFNCNIYIIN